MLYYTYVYRIPRALGKLRLCKFKFGWVVGGGGAEGRKNERWGVQEGQSPHLPL